MCGHAPRVYWFVGSGGLVPSKKRQQNLPITLDRALQREILGVLLVALGVVTVLALLSITKGALCESWVTLLRRVWGWGVYPVALAVIVGGVYLLGKDLREHFSIPSRGIFGSELLFLSLLGLSHLAATPEQAFRLAEDGGGGGYVGWTVSYFVIAAVGQSAAFVILLMVACLGLVLVTSLTWDDLKQVLTRLRARLEKLPKPAEHARSPRVPTSKKKQASRARRVAVREEPQEAVERVSTRKRRRRRDRPQRLTDLLNGGIDEPRADTDIRYKKQVIYVQGLLWVCL